MFQVKLTNYQTLSHSNTLTSDQCVNWIFFWSRFVFLLLGLFGKGTTKLDVPWLLWWLMRWLNHNISIFHHTVGTHLLTDIICLRQIFHSVAYKAKDRNDLLSGIDEFLDQVTVLPPGEWDPSIRIKPPKSIPSQVRLLLWPEAASLCLVWVRRVQHCLSPQEKRKMASISTGSAYTSHIIREAEHHTGPELQRTGRSVGMEEKCSFKGSKMKTWMSATVCPNTWVSRIKVCVQSRWIWNRGIQQKVQKVQSEKKD